MTRESRLALIKRIETARDSMVLAYVTGDRPNLSFQIGADTPRLFFDHLRHLEAKVKRLDLFLYSAGGDTSVPWRIVSLLREFSDEFNVLVPYRAYSAATLLSMGADKIVMGRKAELGPIDPTVTNEFSPIDPVNKTARLPINVEDVFSYIALVKEKVGVVHQPQIGEALDALSSQVNPLALGYVNRHASFIRMIASKMLNSHKKPPTESKVEEVVKNLVEKIYFHGHGISRSEARELGLDVQDADVATEGLLWNLYLEYEAALRLGEIFSPEDELIRVNSEETVLRNVEGAFIESGVCSHTFKCDVSLARRRQMPSTVNVTVNVPTPPGTQQGQPNQQQLQQLQLLVQQIVLAQVRAQSPIIGYDTRLTNLRWEKESNQPQPAVVTVPDP